MKETANDVNEVGDGGTETPSIANGAAAGAYLYCAQFCTSDVVIAGGSGTKSVQVISRQAGQVS